MYGRARTAGACNDSYPDDAVLGKERAKSVELCLTATGAEQSQRTADSRMEE